MQAQIPQMIVTRNTPIMKGLRLVVKKAPMAAIASIQGPIHSVEVLELVDLFVVTGLSNPG